MKFIIVLVKTHDRIIGQMRSLAVIGFVLERENEMPEDSDDDS